MFDITQIVHPSLYVAWHPKFVFSKKFSAHSQFGESSKHSFVTSQICGVMERT